MKPSGFINQIDCRLRAAIRTLVPSPPGPVVMHNPYSANNFPLNAIPTFTHRTQSNSMPNNIQTLNTIPTSQRRIHLHGPLHNPYCKIRIRLRLPTPLLIRAAQNRAPAGRSCHYIASLSIPIVGPRHAEHIRGVVAHNDDLASRGNNGSILDAPELGRHQARAVYDDVHFSAGVEVEVARVEDVLEEGALEGNPIS